MRFVGLIALAALLAAGEASAKTINISGTHSAASVRSACAKAGGGCKCWEAGNSHGCTRICGSGSKTGACTVSCKGDKCKGTVPDKVAGGKGPTDMHGLFGAVAVNDRPPSMPNAGLLGSGPGGSSPSPSPTGTPIAPTPAPVQIIR